MGKGEETKQRILDQAAQLLNRRGYMSSAVSEIMEVTGLQKGGIYNHFESKEDLALQAFDYAVELVSQRFSRALEGKESAIDRLATVISVFGSYVRNVPIAGGCPIMNAAVEGDDAFPALREHARRAMDRFRNLFIRIISKGISRGEIRPDIAPDAVATLLISTLEGAVMLSNLYKDPVHMRRVIDHLIAYVNKDLKA